MNTKQFSDQLIALKQADNAAYKAGTKSNFVIDYIRNEFIKKAFAVNPACTAPVAVEFSMTSASLMAPALALLSKDGTHISCIGRWILYHYRHLGGDFRYRGCVIGHLARRL